MFINMGAYWSYHAVLLYDIAVCIYIYIFPKQFWLTLPTPIIIFGHARFPTDLSLKFLKSVQDNSVWECTVNLNYIASEWRTVAWWCDEWATSRNRMMNNGSDAKSNQQGGRVAPVSCSWKEVRHGFIFREANLVTALIIASTFEWLFMSVYIFGSLTF